MTRVTDTSSRWPADGGRPPSPSETSPAALDAALERLSNEARAFARLGPERKAELLAETRRQFAALAEEMVELGNRAKGVDPRSRAAGEEWFSGPAISLRALRLFEQALREIAQYGAPRIAPECVERTADGGARVVLVQHERLDRLLYRDWRCAAWLEPGAAPAHIAELQAAFYRRPEPEGHVVLVLGAGNIASISVLDVLYHAFVEGGVCLLKMSPVNAYLGPLYERAFAPLIARGYLAITYGGGAVGAYLVDHPLVDAVHVTGSADTHDRIVWGEPGAEREQRRRARAPRLAKRITSELGNVSPVFVVPDRYDARELTAAARSIVGMATHNASFNCNAAKMLVTARDWPQREALLSEIRRVFSDTPTRLAYYPGAEERFEDLLGRARTARADLIGERREGRLPWAFVTSLDASSDDALFRIEPFCSILSEATLPARSAQEFLPLATAFANERLFGTLNAMLIAPARTTRDPEARTALDTAMADLRYGTVSLNVWPAVGYGLGTPLWGGYPGATLDDVQSGIGWGHNALMLERVQKVVLEGSLLALPEPLWYAGHAHLDDLGRAIADIEFTPSVSSLVRAGWAALR